MGERRRLGLRERESEEKEKEREARDMRGKINAMSTRDIMSRHFFFFFYRVL